MLVVVSTCTKCNVHYDIVYSLTNSKCAFPLIRPCTVYYIHAHVHNTFCTLTSPLLLWTEFSQILQNIIFCFIVNSVAGKNLSKTHAVAKHFQHPKPISDFMNTLVNIIILLSIFCLSTSSMFMLVFLRHNSWPVATGGCKLSQLLSKGVLFKMTKSISISQCYCVKYARENEHRTLAGRQVVDCRLYETWSKCQGFHHISW